jgi:methionine-gamma-lyase
MYSTARNLLLDLADRFGVEVTFVDATDAENYKAAVKPNTRLFWIETPSNPLVAITDIRRVADIASAAGIMTAADNTFATPFNQRPLELGVDAVVHSATKYLGGHSDLTAGVLVGSAETVAKGRKIAIKLLGGTIAPQVSWLVSRGIKTLALRMERHNENAYALANTLTDHPMI